MATLRSFFVLTHATVNRIAMELQVTQAREKMR
jgi:hypothetical protein